MPLSMQRVSGIHLQSDMIVRRNKINPKVSHVSFNVAFGQADARRWLREFFDNSTISEKRMEFFRNLDLKEQDYRYWMESSPWVFASYEEPWRVQLSCWLWTQWLNNGYFTPSASREGVYFLTEKALKLGKFRKT